MAHFLKLNIEGIYNGMQPIKPNFEVIKKELKSNDYLKLFGALTILAQNNKELIRDFYCQSLNDVIESASICDSELCLFDFEGYELNERYNIKSLYLDSNDRIMMSVYDNKKDSFIDFLAE